MSDVLLRAEGLAKSFTLHLRGGLCLPVLDGVGLELRAGECVVLGGPSGAGKSTLMRSLYGNYRSDAGRILVRHRDAWVDLAGAEPRAILAVRRETLGYVSQFLRVVPRVCALDVVAEAAARSGAGPEEARARARAMLLHLQVPSRLHGLPPATFSGGEQQRVNLARGLVGGHPILLLDEPTASLDDANRAVVLALLRQRKAAGTAMLAIVHDAAARDGLADRLLPLAPWQGAA